MRQFIFALVSLLTIPLVPEAQGAYRPKPQAQTISSLNTANIQDDRRRATPDAELEELTKDWTEQQKADLLKSLERADADTRAKVIREMLRERREALTIEKVLVRWRPGGPGLTTSGSRSPRYSGGGLTRSDVRALRGLRLKGTLEVVGGGTDGSAPRRVRVVIIMRRQLDQPFRFAVPNEGTVICLQLETGWRLLPPDYPKSKKTIELVKASEKVTYIVKNDAGGISGGTAFNWD